MTGLFLVGFILLALVLVACGGDDGPTAISKAEMGTGIDGSSASGVTTTFKPTDTFYTAVNLTNPKATTKVKATLTAVQTADGTTNRVVTETELTTSNSENFLNFKFTLPNPWPTGKYKVDLLLDGAAAKTLDFEVQ